MGEVLVLVEQVDGAVKKVTGELLTLARDLGTPSAVWVGPGFDDAAAAAATGGGHSMKAKARSSGLVGFCFVLEIRVGLVDGAMKDRTVSRGWGFGERFPSRLIINPHNQSRTEEERIRTLVR